MSWFSEAFSSTNSKLDNADLAAIMQNLSMNKAEFSNLMSIFGQLQPFFSQYMGKGSPLLNQVQSQSTANTSNQFAGNAAQEGEELKGSGFGASPTGTGAGVMGQNYAAEAQASSGNFLKNLLANEQMKFQAAQGLSNLGAMMKPGQTNYVSQDPTASNPLGVAAGMVSGAINGAQNSTANGGNAIAGAAGGIGANKGQAPGWNGPNSGGGGQGTNPSPPSGVAGPGSGTGGSYLAPGMSTQPANQGVANQPFQPPTTVGFNA